MASGKTLNAANLETIGTARLAALILEISTSDVTLSILGIGRGDAGANS